VTIYRGRPARTTGEAVVVVDDGLARERDLIHVVIHSPAGFNWGYGGSGPADLALSILADYFGERQEANGRAFSEKGVERAWRFHQSFKWTYVALWPADKDWAIDDRAIRGFLLGLGNLDAFECHFCRAGLEVAVPGGGIVWKVDGFGFVELGPGRRTAEGLLIRCRRGVCRESAAGRLRLVVEYDSKDNLSTGYLAPAMMPEKEETT
jgi:hypothetical protein